VQSLKSTAFAVTLLAISFGLYCVSSNDTPSSPEAELIDPITIDSSFSTTQSGSMTMPSHNMSNPVAPIQVSTNTAPSLENLPSSRVGNLLPSGNDNSFHPETTAPALIHNTPLKLPPLSQPSAQPAQPATTNQTVPELPSFTQSGFQKQPAQAQQPAPIQLKLPEIAARQSVSTSPAARDNGLIDALETNDFNPQNGNASNDNSFNSQATAVTNTEEENSAVRSAAGSFGNMAVPELKNQPPATPPGKPAPVSIAGVWEEVDQLVAADEYRRALGALSQHYGKKGLTGPQKQKLQGWLDALAGKVIYSTEHLFVKQPHIVQPGETLASISQKFKVPGEVIYNINQGQFNGANEVEKATTT